MENLITTENDKDEILRKTAKEMAFSDIGSQKLSETIEKMKRALKERDDAVAIAAPQIGESLRMFILSGKALLIESLGKDTEGEREMKPDMVFINPEIINLSKEKNVVEEGCLSVPHKCGLVERSQKAKIKALDEEGNKIERGASNLIAEIFQHEMDHLNGILFTDIAKKVYSISENVAEKI